MYRTLAAPEEEPAMARSADAPHHSVHPSGYSAAPVGGREQMLFSLQGSAGNRAVTRLVEQGGVAPPAGEPQGGEATLAPEEPLAEFNELTEAESEDGGTAEEGIETAAGHAPALPLRIQGPATMWWMEGFSPASYLTSTTLATNLPGTGTFAWAATGPLAFSDPAVARPTVTTTGASAARRDATISVTHTPPGGRRKRASYRLTVLAPNELRHLSNVDSADATWTYVSDIHYRIVDQFGVTLPSAVPINERFTAAPTADAAGMNWSTSINGSTVVSPVDWMDHIGGAAAGATPAAVAPNHANAGDAVYHWPGEWRVGSLSIGLGKLVATVTWQKYRGRARHL
jgi:hypothetical protein